MIEVPETDTFFKENKNTGEREFSILKPHIKNYRICLDIGAHVGVMSLRYSKYFETVHAFEPMVYNYLVKNTKNIPNIITHSCAVSDKNGEIDIYPNPKNTTGGIIPDEYNESLIHRRYFGENAPLMGVEKTSVKTSYIDFYNFKDVDLIKIDTEGHILPVVNGMINTLKYNSPTIQMETSRSKLVNEEVNKILEELGYIKFKEYNPGGTIDWFYYKT